MDMPKGLKQVWIDQWSILEGPRRDLPAGICGEITGDPHIAARTVVSVYNLRRIQITQSWVSTDTRVYILGTRKEA